MTEITISLPQDLIEFADAKAAVQQTSRAHVIADILRQMMAREEEQVAIEGYRFYARESEVFAEGSRRAVSESFEHAG